MTSNKTVLAWLDEMAAMCTPEKIVWIDGSEEQLEALRAEAVSTGEMIKLNEEKLPGCYYHRTAENDVARVEDRTFICTPTKEEAGPINNWIAPDEMYAKMKALYAGSMAGRTMYVIPYSMGPVGSPFSKIGVELTDSIYVVLNMAIMTRIGKAVIDQLGDDADFVKCLHAKKDVNPDDRYIVQFPQDSTIWSINSAYGGNVLLGKKCLALRIGSYLGKQEGWMAEHMLILKVEKEGEEPKYVCGAFPSACGKTNLAMLTPPDYFKEQGYKVSTIGDDISWLRIGEDGRLYAVNPENGFFGVAPGTNMKSNPNAMLTTMKGTIFTNVARNLDENTVWWESMDKNPPANGEDWLGNPWNGPEADVKGAHPNSRFTAPAANCPIIADEFATGEGVPISAIIFGGRRAKAEPLVYQAKDWNHGVFIGSAMASETTAAANGQVGVVRHDPMAMLPFCGYNMAEYFQHWIDMGKKMTNPPKIFHVNWFRTDENDQFMWPGFGDNLRAILWMLDRCDGKIDAEATPLGLAPKKGDLNVTGLDLSDEVLEKLFAVNKADWEAEVEGIQEFYDKFDSLPVELTDALATLKAEIEKL